MNRTAIKNFAVWARRELREQIAVKAARYGISTRKIEEPAFVSGGMVVAGHTYNATDTTHYKQLQHDLQQKVAGGASTSSAVEAIIDETAYTWFNRLTALRFMEVNNYLPSRALSSSSGLVDPDLLRDAAALITDGKLGKTTLNDLEAWRKNSDGETYRNLLIAQCHSLAKTLPYLFGEAKDYADLFLPDNLLMQGTVLRKLVSDIPEDDWKEIEIIGWLYQFYISERKDEVIGAKTTVAAKDIPAATQLFTPHWIVRYMVENSLGRLWLEHHPNSGLREKMPYYLESANAQQTNPLPVKGEEILSPEALTLLDPACGSGHILVYAFDLLVEIYKEAGYSEREIPRRILEKNLYGLDIDERAVQLTSFALLMKARQHNRRILDDPPKPNLKHVAHTRGLSVPAAPQLNPKDWEPLLAAFKDADSLGSLITPPEFNAEELHRQLIMLKESGTIFANEADELRHVLEQAELLRKQYKLVVANPPYIGNKNLNKALKTFLESKYTPYKSDAFSAFVVRCLGLVSDDGQLGFMTPFVWMFISSYENLREKIIHEHTLSSLVQLEYSGFDGATVPICTYTLLKRHIPGYTGEFVRLSSFRGAENQGLKTLEAAADPNCAWRFHTQPDKFTKIPGSPIAYWVSRNILKAFEKGMTLGEVSNPVVGLQTGQNGQFLKLWFEPNFCQLGIGLESRKAFLEDKKKWIPYNKGGQLRKWYGNNEWVVNWANDGEEITNFKPRSVIRNPKYYFRSGITWSDITTRSFAARYSPKGFIFDVKGSSGFPDEKKTFEILGLMSSNLLNIFMSILNPSITFQVGDIARVPYHQITDSRVPIIVGKMVEISKQDWDNFETSWDFQTFPLLRGGFPKLSEAFADWQQTSDEAFYELKRLEEENNRYWIAAYGLESELSPEVPEDQITIRRADLERDVRGLISYAVGCMFGRYSLAKPGLQFAGGTFTRSSFTGDFLPDEDGILPVTDEEYFPDDIVSRFREFLRVAYGEKFLLENLDFVATALGKKASETAQACIRRYFSDEFIHDHISTYSKRPIYWLLTSGKKGAFGALVYLHRYTDKTLATVRNEYVLKMQTKLATRIEQLQEAAEGAGSASAKKKFNNELKKLREQQAELLGFQDKLQHAADQRIKLDLDDGVAYNYTLLKGLVYEGNDLKMADLEKHSAWKRALLGVVDAAPTDEPEEAEAVA